MRRHDRALSHLLLFGRAALRGTGWLVVKPTLTLNELIESRREVDLSLALDTLILLLRLLWLFVMEINQVWAMLNLAKRNRHLRVAHALHDGEVVFLLLVNILFGIAFLMCG